MSTRSAIVLDKESESFVRIRHDVPLPKLQDEYIIVKTKAVALNPTDWKVLKPERITPGAISGCDYAGIVEEVGSAVTTPFKKGDRVAGFISGANRYNSEWGAFASHVTAKGDIQIRIADNISFEDAATLGVGITTVGQGMYQLLGLPLPPAKVREPTSILIYGASTATGTLAVQYAKISGLEVFATASPHNFDLVKSLGADHVFDYKDPDCGKKIREASNNNLQLAFDTISEHNSPRIVADAISTRGGLCATLLDVKNFPRDDVRVGLTLGYTAVGEKFGERYPANYNDFEFATRFWRLSEELVNSGKVKAHPAEVREGGLEAIPKGLEDLREGRVSGVKLVYKLD